MRMGIRRVVSVLFIMLLLLCICFSFAMNVYASHKHDKQVNVTFIQERNGYITVKWRRDKACKSYCVHLQCGKKVLYNHCVGKTQDHYKIKVTNTLGKKLDKCGNWSAIVYCSDKAKGSVGGGGG